MWEIELARLLPNPHHGHVFYADTLIPKSHESQRVRFSPTGHLAAGLRTMHRLPARGSDSCESILMALAYVLRN